MFRVDLGKKNNRQAYQQKLYRLEKQKHWCEENQSLKLKDCQIVLKDYQFNKEAFEFNLKTNINEHELCFKKTSISDAAIKILPMTKRVLPLYKSGNEKLSIDGPFCNIATGLTSALFDDLGFVRGQDYLFQSGTSHVYLTLPKENKIVDPTFAQFFDKDSPAHQLIMKKSGFVGTPTELFNFLFEHRNELAYCREPQKGCKENFYSKQLKEINANANKLESKAALEKLFKDLFYGENWNPEKKVLIDTAISTSDYFGKNRETYVHSHGPELKQIVAELDAFQCMNKNKDENLICNHIENTSNKNTISNSESFSHTVQIISEIINVHEINNVISH